MQCAQTPRSPFGLFFNIDKKYNSYTQQEICLWFAPCPRTSTVYVHLSERIEKFLPPTDHTVT